MSEAAVKLENISKFYKLYKKPKDRLKEALHPLKKLYHRKFYALKNINLDIKKGEILGIIGRNGSGKSSLLKLISAVIQPSSGKVIVNGAVSALLELGAGLEPEFTGIQNIYFSGTMMGFTREEMKTKVDDIAAFADIGDFIYQPLKTYSSGMKARMGFALAINMEPKILILDEVLAVGDELFKRKCYVKMEEFFKSGCTVLYVSHNMNTVNEICTRSILLDKGGLILEGPSKLVTTYYQKFLYATGVNQNRIREEIIQLNKDEKKKREFAADLEKKEMKPPGKDMNEVQIHEIEQVPKQKALYLPDFKPKSTIVYKNYEVDIDDIHLKTIAGENVNALVMDEEYIYSYKVRFNIDAGGVVYGSRINTEKGFLISGMNSKVSLKKSYEVSKGEEYLIQYKFKCHLLPGNYFITTGVSSIIKGKRVFLNRIVDALVFKVQETPSNVYKGIIHLHQKLSIEKLN
jgi:lipopolysaccharide transport system ATP-binding protein